MLQFLHIVGLSGIDIVFHALSIICCQNKLHEKPFELGFALRDHNICAPNHKLGSIFSLFSDWSQISLLKQE